MFFQKVKRVGKGFADIPFINKNGVERWWNVNAVKLSDSQYMAFVKDITERKYVEDKLKINKKLLRTFMDSAPDSYHLYDSQLRLIEFNEQATRSGINENMIGKHILEITNDIEKTGRYEEYLKVIETGKTFYREDIVGSNKDECRHVTIRAFKAGSGMGLIISDVTDAVHSETQYRKLLELSNDAIFLHDFDSKIIDVNARACELLGYSREQLLSMKIQDFHHTESAGVVGSNKLKNEGDS